MEEKKEIERLVTGKLRDKSKGRGVKKNKKKKKGRPLGCVKNVDPDVI